MTLPCKWITDQAGPLVCREGQHGYSWSICASGAECPGVLPRPMTWPQTTAIAQPGSSLPQQCVTCRAARASGSALKGALPADMNHQGHPGTFAPPEPARPAA
jgi:hypothetical protein